MTHHENNIKACLLLEQIEDQAGHLWSQCQYYGSDKVSQYMLRKLQVILNQLITYNEQMER